jgi:putative membrane protein
MDSLRLFINGFLIGIANIIPGMSGGTLALVLGIYERLIGALRRIGLSTGKKLLGGATLRKNALEEARAELQRIDFGFLALLGSGAIAAVLLTSKLIV